MTLFLVEAGWEGFERGRNLNKLGLKAQDTAELFFNNIKVPKSNVLGEAHKGFYYLHSRIVGPYITRFGSEDQIERYIPGAISGDIILAVAMTEPDAGSNLAGMRTHAVEEDDHWVLNGQKTYISNGINCDLWSLPPKQTHKITPMR